MIPRPSTTPQKHLQLTPKAWSRASTEQSSDDEAVEWSSSPAHTPTRQLREELEVAPPISIAAPRSSHDLLHNTNETSRQDHQATLENPAQSQESFNQLSDYEPVPWSPSSPVRSPGTQLREELGAEPPSSIGAPSSPQAPDAAEATGWNFQPAEPELPSRPLISQGDNPEARDQSDHIVTERQTDDGPMADDKSKAADELDVCGNPPLSTPSYSPVNAPISTSWPTSVAPHTEQDSHHKTSGQSLKDSSISHNELQTGNGPVAGDKPEAGDEPKVGDKSIADNRSTIGSELDNSINSVDESKGEASDTNQRRTTSKRVTRAANGIIKTRRATEPLVVFTVYFPLNPH